MEGKTGTMFKKLTIAIISILILASPGYAQIQEILASATIGVNGDFEIVEDTPGLPSIDDFNDGGSVNHLGGSTGTFAGNSGTATTSNDNTTVGNGFALQIDYDVTANNSFSGYFTQLQSANFNPYGFLSFDIRGANGGEYFKIQLKTNSGTHQVANLMITDVLGGTATQSWQTVQIPFLSFVNLADVSSMNELVFVFENAQAATNGSPLQGTIFVDNIQVISGSPTSLLIDNFNDFVGTTSLGANIVDISEGQTGISHNFNGTEMVTSVQLGDTNNFAGQVLFFGGGSEAGGTPANQVGFVPISRSEFMSFNAIEIQSRTISANPNIKVELQVNIPGEGFVNAFKHFSPNGFDRIEFTELRTFLPAFPTLDDFHNQVTAIQGQIAFVVERGGGSDASSFAIDNVSFAE